MFHSFFFNSLVRSRYLSFFSYSFHILSVLFCGQTEQQSRQFCKFSFFLLLITIRYGLLAEIRWSVSMSVSQRSLCVSFSWTGAGLCMYNLLVWSNLNFLHISQWITLPTQLCLILYFFCANLQHSLIMWLMVSSLLLYSLHLLFCCVLSILALIWLVLTALFCAAIRRDYYHYYFYYFYHFSCFCFFFLTTTCASQVFSIFFYQSLKRFFAQNIYTINTTCIYRSNLVKSLIRYFPKTLSKILFFTIFF